MVQNDPLNRRFTTASLMDIAGPMRGTDHVKTKFSPTGTQARGTNNNCGNGYTPWGTYLTCEENWPGIFVNKATRPDDQVRIGVSATRGQYRWETAAGDASEVQDEFTRFDVTPTGASATDDYRNEASTYGYIVEIGRALWLYRRDRPLQQRHPGGEAHRLGPLPPRGLLPGTAGGR